jgi:predicted TPR repeat methyltransferase
MSDAATVLALARQYHQAGCLGQAEALYRQVLDAQPQDVHARFYLGVVCQVQGRMPESIAHYRRCLEIQPDFAEVLSNLGVGYASQGLLNEALGCYRQAARLKPASAEVHNNLGLLLASRGDWHEASASYRRALALKPDHAEAWNNFGILHLQLQRPDEAVRCFQRAAALRPGYVDAVNNLGNTLHQQGKSAEAADCYRQVLVERPDHTEALVNLGVVCLRLRQRDEAVACWQRSLLCNDNDARPHRNLAKVFYYEGKRDQALHHYRQVLRCCPDDVEARVLVEALGGCSKLSQVPANYVASLYDESAAGFDQESDGRGPALLKAAVAPPAAVRSLDVLDLGCGTGLCGAQFRDWARTLVGVDVSREMLGRARQRGVYDELILGDFLAPLQGVADQFDLVVASDSLIFLGDLDPVTQAVARALRPGGRFAFTVELLEGPGYHLLPAVHFAHSPAYLQEVTSRNQLDVEAMDPMVFRTVNGQDIPGLAVVLRRAIRPTACGSAKC